MAEWQDMDDCPKREGPLLVYATWVEHGWLKGPDIFIAVYQENEGTWTTYDNDDFELEEVLRWMPLPDPPTNTEFSN